MDRFDAGFESTYCCMHKLVISVLNDPNEIKLLRNNTENSPNKENVFGIDQMLPVASHWPLEWKHICIQMNTQRINSIRFRWEKMFPFLVIFIQKEAEREKENKNSLDSVG